MSNRKNFEEAVKCFADPQRRKEYFEIYSDDIVVHGYQGIEPGLENVKQFYYAFWKVFPDAQARVQDLFGEDDKLGARYVITGTMRESFMGVAATHWTANQTSRDQHFAFQQRPVL